MQRIFSLFIQPILAVLRGSCFPRPFLARGNTGYISERPLLRWNGGSLRLAAQKRVAIATNSPFLLFCTWSLTHGHDRSVRRERDRRQLHPSWPHTRLAAQPGPASTAPRAACIAAATAGQALRPRQGTSWGRRHQLRPPTIPSAGVVGVPGPRRVSPGCSRRPVEGRGATPTVTD